MGYTTTFDGQFDVTPALQPEHAAYLRAFAYTRRMKRSAAKTTLRPDFTREAVSLPVGSEGAYFVGAQEDYGQEFGAADIIDPDNPPTEQPSLWCNWVPNDDDTAIVWNGEEKFYNYTAWLEYLVQRFLAPWGYAVDGEVAWTGEDPSDLGLICVENNIVTVKRGRVVYK